MMRHDFDEEPIDLSALGPEQDPARWQAITERTLQRVDQVLAEPGESPLTLIAGWRRPLLAAALAASVVLTVMELALERREWRTERIQRLVAVSARWPGTGRPPSGSDFVRALSSPAGTQGVTP